MSKIFIGFCFGIMMLIAANAFSQNNDGQNQNLKVFIDCTNTWCDHNFLKTEITIVDFLSDHKAADVHILITSHQTGSGGYRFQIIFFGQHNFKSNSDTIAYYLEPNATETQTREMLVKYLELGLAPFVAKTGMVSGVTIKMKTDSLAGIISPAGGKRDPWNYWVINLQTDGNNSGEKTYKNYGYNTNITLSRLTEEMKTGVSVYAGKNRSDYTYETDSAVERFIAKNSYYGLQHYFVKSIHRHWGAAYECIFTNSTFSNYKRQLYLRMAVEYDVFPYREFSTRLLTFSYGVILRFNRYYDSTLYNKLKESLLAHSLRTSLILNKKWGTINSAISYSNFLQDWKLNNLKANLTVSVRLTGKISCYLSVKGGLIHDQVYLPKAGVTEEEVLTRLRELKTSYYYQNRIGINYRFGSQLNNFVNARFDSD